ncbi:MAG: PTS system mannose/fructose/sorbose family transporter subunit IID [Nitrospirota bacterium]|nr:PTS system mannose/fructose/sorbose family transporter subunit IID [Nitrospirota bacterium]
MADELRRVRTVDLLGVFWRSFFIQASWSYARMQSLGFAFALIPVLRRLYPDRQEFSARLAAHMDYFNTQPYMASFILGAAARIEEDRATGRDPGADAGEVKRSLMAPLGALGDSFFWGSLKPLAAVIAVATLFDGSWWAPLLYLALYNVVHIGFRGGLVFAGYALRGDVVALMARFNFAQVARLFKVLSLAVLGGIVGTITLWRPELRMPVPVPGITLASLTIALGLAALFRRGWSPLKLMMGLGIVCLLLALGGI